MRPMIIAFVVAAIGAVVLLGVAALAGSGGTDWTALLVGVAVTTAATGIVASVMQFLPNHLYSPVTIAAGIIVSLLVFVLLRATEVMGLQRVSWMALFVWATAVVVALIVSRESGIRPPPVAKASR